MNRTPQKAAVQSELFGSAATKSHPDAPVISRIAPVPAKKSNSPASRPSPGRNKSPRPQIMWYNIYTGRRRLGCLRSEDIDRLGLVPGRSLDGAIVEFIASETVRHDVLVFAWKLIEKRMYSGQQLRDRIAVKFPAVIPEIIGTVLDDLARAGVIDDAAFARALVAELNRSRPAGPGLIRQRLAQAGILDETVVAQALESTRADEFQAGAQGGDDALSAFLRRRLDSLRGLAPRKAAERLYRAGMQRGFDADQVRSKVEDLVGVSFDASDEP